MQEVKYTHPAVMLLMDVTSARIEVMRERFKSTRIDTKLSWRRAAAMVLVVVEVVVVTGSAADGGPSVIVLFGFRRGAAFAVLILVLVHAPGALLAALACLSALAFTLLWPWPGGGGLAGRGLLLTTSPPGAAAAT